jgi:hypothetical protein
MSGRLKGALEVDDVGVVDGREDALLALYMLYLLQSYYFALFQTLQS